MIRKLKLRCVVCIRSSLLQKIWSFEKKLPSVAPEKFWIQHYYNSLEKALEHRLKKVHDASKGSSSDNQHMSVHSNGGAPVINSDSHKVAACSKDASSMAGIDVLLAGEGFTTSNETSEVLSYMSGVETLESTKDKAKCK